MGSSYRASASPVSPELQVVQAAVPPVVDGEEARRPAGRRGGEEVNAVPLAALHLEDVRQRVHRPDVLRIVVQGGPGARLGLPVVRVLLQPERVDALHVSPAGPVARPGRQHPGGGVAEFKPVAEEEVEVLGHLEGEQVARVAQQRPLQRAGGGFPVALGPVPGGPQVMEFPLAHDRLVQPLQDLARGGAPPPGSSRTAAGRRGRYGRAPGCRRPRPRRRPPPPGRPPSAARSSMAESSRATASALPARTGTPQRSANALPISDPPCR